MAHLKRLIVAVLLYSACGFTAEPTFLRWDEISSVEEERLYISLRGFVIKEGEEQWLSPQPVIPSCCAGIIEPILLLNAPLLEEKTVITLSGWLTKNPYVLEVE